MNRRFAIFLAATLVVASALYAALWLYGARQLQDLTERWAADLRAEGWTIDMPEVSTEGFPGTARVVIPGMRVEAPAGKGGWTWQTDDAVLEVRPWRIDEPLLVVEGTQLLHLPTGERWVGHANTAQALLTLDSRGRAEKVDVLVEGLGMSRESDRAEVGVDHLGLTLEDFRAGITADYRTTSYRVAATVYGVRLPLREDSAFAPGPRSLAVIARVLGPFPLDRPLRNTLSLWRDAGGAVEIDDLTLIWPPLSLGGSGTVALDADLQPVGAFSARLSDIFATVDALERGGIIGKKEATMARVVLGLASTREGDTDAGATLPITVQNRTLSVGPVKVVELPRITWADGEGS